MRKRNLSRTDVESSSKKCGKKKNKVLKQIEQKQKEHMRLYQNKLGQIRINQDLSTLVFFIISTGGF